MAADATTAAAAVGGEGRYNGYSSTFPLAPFPTDARTHNIFRRMYFSFLNDLPAILTKQKDFLVASIPFLSNPAATSTVTTSAAATAVASAGLVSKSELEPISKPQPNPKFVASLSPPPSLVPRAESYLSLLDIQRLISSLQRFLPAGSSRRPVTRPVRSRRPPELSSMPIPAGRSLPLFRPYVAKVPWHGGVRAFLSQLFPRYGHYCGPNWSSGKDQGSMLWDRRPIDWLDFCCYCHDMGYDSEDQAKLLKADLAFLECLEKPRMPTKGDVRVAELYKSMCIAGLRNILIPYRMQLVRLQGKQSLTELMGSIIGKKASCGRD